MLYSSLGWDRLQWLAGHIHERIYHFITEPLQTHLESHYELKLELGSPVVPVSFHCNNRPFFSRKIFRLPFGPLMTELYPTLCFSCLSCCLIALCIKSALQLYFVLSERVLAVLTAFDAVLLCSALSDTWRCSNQLIGNYPTVSLCLWFSKSSHRNQRRYGFYVLQFICFLMSYR